MNNLSVFCHAVRVLSIGRKVHESVSVSGPCFVNHHTRSTFNSQLLRKPRKRLLFSRTPKCWIMLIKKYEKKMQIYMVFLSFDFSNYAPRRISGEHIVAASSVRPCVRVSVRPCVRASVPLLSTQILGNCLSDFNETSWEY